jgi:hypothetical protein
MRDDYTAVALLIDRSGSMSSIKKVTQDAINEFIYGQAHAEGKRTIRLAQFDSHYETVHTSLPAAECPEFVLEPRGTTSLYDAMASIIDEFGRELREMPEHERPANVLVAIMTDGQENTSTFCSAKDVRAKVEHQQNHYNWNFLFMGANQDAVLTGSQMGMKANSTISYSASGMGVTNTREVLDSYVVAVAAGAAPSISDEDRRKAMKNK